MKMKKDLNKKVDYYIAPTVKSMLDKAKVHVITKDWDRVYIIDGEEGSGKSLMGLQFASYLDPTFHLDRVVFNGLQFSKAINNAKRNECIVFDEAFNGLDSSSAMSGMNKLIVRKLMECRQKNLFIIIILPTVFLLQKYAAIFRSKALFHVYATSRGDRGYYRVYNKHNKKMLYMIGKKLYSYSQPYIKKSYRFYGKYPIDEELYRKKKLDALEDVDKEKEKINKYVPMFAAMCRWVNEEHNVSYEIQSSYLKSRMFPISRSMITRMVRELPKPLPKEPENPSGNSEHDTIILSK